MDNIIRRARGYLPHIELSGASYFVTFRLADSLPSSVLIEWKNEIEASGIPHIRMKPNIDPIEYFKKVEEYLDSGRGNCVLKDERIGALVVQAFKTLRWNSLQTSRMVRYAESRTRCFSTSSS